MALYGHGGMGCVLAAEAGQNGPPEVPPVTRPAGDEPDADRLNAAELRAVREQNGQGQDGDHPPPILGAPLMLQTVSELGHLN